MNVLFIIRPARSVLLVALCLCANAQVPQLLNYQGRVQVGTTDFNGTGQFKFALINADGTTTYWSNDGTPAGQPASSVTLPVTKGLYSVLLGNTVLPNMTAVPPAAFANGDVHLRVWFNDGVNGFQQFVPDQRIAAVGYAIMAGTAQTAAGVASGAITTAMLADGAVTSNKLAIAAVTAPAIAAGAVTSNAIANAAIGPAQLARKYAAGRFDISLIGGAGFSNSFELVAGYGFAFGVPPIVNYQTELISSGTESPAELSLVAKGTNSFTLRVANAQPSISTVANGAYIPPSPLNTPQSFGRDSSMAIVNGRPAIACFDPTSNKLLYFRAYDEVGWTWTPGVDVDPAGVGNGGSFTSLAVVDGKPAIAYRNDATKQLKFVQALDADGATWGTPVTVLGSDVGMHLSLSVINGNPAIAYTTDATEHLMFIRANNATGTAWGTPVTVFANGVGFTSLLQVNGAPAIFFHHKARRALGYHRALDANGTSWWLPLIIADGEIDGYGFGEFASAAIVGGRPAVAFFADGTGHSNSLAASQVRFALSSDTNGSTWFSYSVVAEGEIKTCQIRGGTSANGTPIFTKQVIRSAADLGRGVSLAVVNGNPAVLFRGNRLVDLDALARERSAAEEARDGDSGWSWIPADSPLEIPYLGGLGDSGNSAGTSSADDCPHYETLKALQYARANDPFGQFWGPRIDILGKDVADGRLIMTTLGPAACYSVSGELGYRYSSQPNGEAWNDTQPAFEFQIRKIETDGILGQVTLTNGLPYVMYYDPGQGVLRGISGLDKTGSSWSTNGTAGVIDAGAYVGSDLSLAAFGGGVGLAYYDSTSRDLKFVFFNGSSWSAPIRVDTAGVTGIQPSLALVDGVPAISYAADTNGGVLRFVRATGPRGETWGVPVTVSPGTVQDGGKLRVVNGRPAITFRRFASGSWSLLYQRALDATGTSWGSAVTVAANLGVSAEHGFEIVNGRPAVSLKDNLEVRFIRAADTDGNSWSSPVLLDGQSPSSAEKGLSLFLVGSYPAVAYGSNDTALFVRALDANGASWGAPVVANNSTGTLFSLQLLEITGKPALAFQRGTAANLRFSVATSAEGTNWSQPSLIDGVGRIGSSLALALSDNGTRINAAYNDSLEGAIRVARAPVPGNSWIGPMTPDNGAAGKFLSAALVNGLPAASYYDEENGDLRFHRAIWNSGEISWNWLNIRTLDTNGNVGMFTSLASLSNQAPAVAYYDAGNGNLKYVRATETNGVFWGIPLVLDATGDVGRYTSLAVVQGHPAIAYYDVTQRDLKYIRATDPLGASWGTAITVDAGPNNSDVGRFASLVVANGRPAIGYWNDTDRQLRYVRAADVLGAAWGTPQAMSFGPSTAQDRMVLRIINGKPAFAYTAFRSSFLPGPTPRIGPSRIELSFAHAADANGDTWNAPVTPLRDSEAAFLSLGELNQNPSITFLTPNGVRNIYPLRPFLVNWFAVEP